MSFTNPTTPNLTDFAAFVYANGASSPVLPFGSMGTVAIDTSGNLTAATQSGTVSAGMALVGTGLIDTTYLSTYSPTSFTGTVSPVPSSAVSDATVAAWSPYLAWAFNQASGANLNPPPFLTPIIWVLATYNYGMHLLLKIAQDQPNQSFFQNLRTQFKLGSFLAGVLSNASDEGTGAAIVVADPFKNLSLGNLDLLKTPYGREYLAYIQSYGPTIVGVS